MSILKEEAILMEKADADMLHLDVMDGHFVPNITFGAPVIKSLRGKTNIHFDVHLMIEKPEDYIQDFALAGADTITFHIESQCDPGATIALIQRFNVRAGIAIKPGTTPEVLYPYLNKADMILVMTVEPGFGGQKYMADMAPKIKDIRKRMESLKVHRDIQVDGGIDNITVKEAAAAGANVFVAGSYLFNRDNYGEGVALLRHAAMEALSF